MKRRFALLLSILLCAVPVLAQQGDSADEVATVLAALSERLGETVTQENATVTVRATEFQDGSLGCNPPGDMTTMVVIFGYQILVEYEGVVYDYRIAENAATAQLCQELTPGEQGGAIVRPIGGDEAQTVPQQDTMLDGVTWNAVTELEVSGDLVALSPDGGLLAVAGNDDAPTSVILYDANEPEKPQQVLNAESEITALAFHPQEVDTLIVGDASGGVTVWRARSQRLVLRFAAHDSAILDLSISSEGRLITRAEDGTLVIWDVMN